jgi:hypothetical protein
MVRFCPQVTAESDLMKSAPGEDLRVMEEDLRCDHSPPFIFLNVIIYAKTVC